MTLVSFNEDGDLRQVDVRVEKVNQPKRDRMIFAVARRDETGRTVIKPLIVQHVQGVTDFQGSQYAEVEVQINQRDARKGS